MERFVVSALALKRSLQALPIAINPNQWKHGVQEDNERRYR
jgi:hypothetical protein